MCVIEIAQPTGNKVTMRTGYRSIHLSVVYMSYCLSVNFQIYSHNIRLLVIMTSTH